ncbi:MAG: thioredoxin family protein [Ginsengibacter sp.]|jgi:thioredoxin-related protein
MRTFIFKPEIQKMKAHNLFTLCLFTFAMHSNAKAQTKPLSANEIVNTAQKEAAKSNKNILIIFHASWCVWCHKMDAALNDEKVKKFFDNNYVIKHLTVDESKDKKELENPGANELRTKYHGDNQGIPYWFILDKNGKLLADSRMINDAGKTGNNVGCPSDPEEVDYFVNVIAKTSRLTNNQLNLIKERFLKNKETAIKN